MTRPIAPENTLIDSHCHLDDAAFDVDRTKLQQQARAAGVSAQIIPAITALNWPRVQRISAEYPAAFPAYGLHPMFLDQHQPSDLALLADWLQAHPETVAVGECGLDFSQSNSDRQVQQQLFATQLDLAREHTLPVIIHARGAVEAVIDTIRASRHYCGVVHSFNGSVVQASRLIDLGYRLGFGGAATYPRASKLQALIRQLPLDALLLETDAPWQAPWQSDVKHAGNHKEQYKGLRNEPAWLAQIFHSVCELRAESAEQIAHTTSANATKLFGLEHKPSQASGQD